MNEHVAMFDPPSGGSVSEYDFSQLIDLERVRTLLDDHNKLSGMAYGVFDAHENNLIAVGWQDICTKFHRIHPVTCERCRESDAFIKAHLHDRDGDMLEYHCKNNMIDIAMPIVIDGRHLATFFTGQFFYDDDPPRRPFFEAQADDLGFDKNAYLAALDRVPVFSRTHVRGNVLFLHGMVQILAETGLQNLRLAREIADRKRAEKALIESEDNYRRIIGTSNEGIWILNADGITTFINTRMAEILGYSEGEIIGRPFADFLFEEDLPDHWQRLQHRRSGQAEHYERRFKHRDGHALWMLASATPQFDESHRFCGSFAMMTDITERKRAEEELCRYKDQLEDTVQQRTAELLLSRNAAEAANRAKSVFLANMSHELRTPLNAILGFANLVRRDTRLSDTQRENLDIIKRSGEHLLTLINDVLEIAKIEAGRVQLEIAPFDLRNMVHDVLDMMRLRAKEKGLQLLVDMDDAFPHYVVGDESRLRQILVNLVGNAIKFTEQGGVTLRLSAHHNDHLHLLIEVEDTGPGISLEDQARLFQPFVQLAEGGEQKGPGLGLTITRQFVELMGGRVTVQSTLGQGSVFRVEVPVEAAEAVQVPVPRERVRGGIVGLAPGQPRYRILIAEDQHENQLLLSRLIMDIGLETRIAENGDKAVRLFEEWQPDLILMDRRMPVMDGEEATRKIRRLPGGGRVKIVAVTASAFREDHQKILDAGMDDFVRKPYRFSDIYDCLERLLHLKYSYQANQDENLVPVKLTPAMLSGLSADLRKSLKHALLSLDDARIATVLDEVIACDPVLGRLLAVLTAYFNYPAILAALDSPSIRDESP